MDSSESKDSYLGIYLYEEHQINDIKLKLEDEIIKNEYLERKIRNMEFDQLKKINELNRKIQELEFKNNHIAS